jgi:DNA-binding CsgD family transcriptional regulator
VRDAAPSGFRARRFFAGDDEMVIASFPLPHTSRQVGPPLTAAEREVIAALLEGQSYAEIARRRDRSVDTVAKQAGSAFRKLGVSSRSELVARGILPVRDGDPDES